jgi:hypothetical protein
MGRPTKLTARVIRDICTSITTAGVYLETAALYAGVDRHTFKTWLKKAGELRRRVEDEGYVPVGKDEQLLVKFRADVDRAIAKLEVVRVLNITKAGSGDGNNPGDWRAQAWLLERQMPQNWSAKHRLEVAGAQDGTPIQVEGLTIKVVQANMERKALTEIPRPAGPAESGKEVDRGDQEAAGQEGEAAGTGQEEGPGQASTGPGSSAAAGTVPE